MKRCAVLLYIYLFFSSYPFHAHLTDYRPRPHFITSLHQAAPGHFHKKIHNKPRLLKLFMQLYEHNNLSLISVQPDPKIPKIIHQIWLGSTFPQKFSFYTNSWLKYHPEWEYKLWTDNDIEEFVLVNKKLFDETPNYGQKADIARYEILYKYGGLYIDVDFEGLRSFDLFHHAYTFYTGVSNTQELELNNALIGAAPGHPILKLCIDNLKSAGTNPTPSDIIQTTGPLYFTEIVAQYLEQNAPCNDIGIFPPTFFYPLPNTFAKKISSPYLNAWLRPESWAIHYWACSWQSP
jgi:inositol phosphorylceramide mannosyltransferase catalytic subunit